MKQFLNSIVQSGAIRAMGAFLLTQYIRVIWWTGRWTVEGAQIPRSYWERGAPFILAFWHGRILMMPQCWRRDRMMRMLISRHRDGELITRAVRPFGIETIRGSAANPKKQSAGGSDKGGMAALREMVKALRAGDYVGITPDGPRGPRMRASDGITAVARLSGAPVIPCAWSAGSAHAFSSWDRFLMPLPFSRGVMIWGEPIFVPRDADSAILEAKRIEIEDAMNRLCARADAAAGRMPIEPEPLGAPAEAHAA